MIRDDQEASSHAPPSAFEQEQVPVDPPPQMHNPEGNPHFLWSQETWNTFMAFISAQNMVPNPNQAESSQPVRKLSKLIKEVRQLGSVPFCGTTDALEASRWLRTMQQNMDDMELSDEEKLRVATRLLEQSAATWWQNMSLRLSAKPTWMDFQNAFQEKYFTYFKVIRKGKSL